MCGIFSHPWIAAFISAWVCVLLKKKFSRLVGSNWKYFLLMVLSYFGVWIAATKSLAICLHWFELVDLNGLGPYRGYVCDDSGGPPNELFLLMQIGFWEFFYPIGQFPILYAFSLRKKCVDDRSMRWRVGLSLFFLTLVLGAHLWEGRFHTLKNYLDQRITPSKEFFR